MTLDKPMTFLKWFKWWALICLLIERYTGPWAQIWWITGLCMVINAAVYYSIKEDNPALDERFLTERQAEAIRKAEQN